MCGPVLSVRDARKAYGDTTALGGVDLDLAPGEWLGLLGPNGAGKTTLVRAIAGRVRLDGGSVALFGDRLDGARAPELRSRLGIVPQDIALYATLTARENLLTFGSLCGLKGRTLSERVKWGLEFTGLADRSNDLVGKFSGGMKRRLNIACSVLHQPEVILLDEPTVGVDPQSRERVWEMLTDLRSQGASLLLTSHQLDEVERVCERIVIIDHGSVIAEGSVASLIADTIGTGRQVTLMLDQQTARERLPAGFEVQNGRAVCTIDSVAHELPRVLTTFREAGVVVEDVHIETPSLQAVFIHLTGRELRE